MVVNVGKHFVAATYSLEGDGALSLSCYEQLQTVCNACQLDMMRFPNLHAVSQDVSASIPEVTKEWATEYGYSCVQDAIRWFQRKFNIYLYDTLRAFKAARLFCPATVRSLAATPATLQQLRVFPFFDSDVVTENLGMELPVYLAAAEDVFFEGDSTEKSKKKVG